MKKDDKLNLKILEKIILTDEWFPGQEDLDDTCGDNLSYSLANEKK
jgi:hypothetical protein